MEASHKTHRPHIKMGKHEEEYWKASRLCVLALLNTSVLVICSVHEMCSAHTSVTPSFKHVDHVLYLHIMYIYQPHMKEENVCMYSGTSAYVRSPHHYGHTGSVPNCMAQCKLASCNTVTSPLRSLLPSPVGARISEVPLYCSSLK